MRVFLVYVLVALVTAPFPAPAEPFVGEIDPASIRLSQSKMTFTTIDGLKGSMECQTAFHLEGRAWLHFELEDSHEMSLVYDSEWLQMETPTGGFQQFDFSLGHVSCPKTLAELRFNITQSGRARLVASKAEHWITPDGPRRIWISTVNQ